jgi:hypothetical protein
VLEGKNKEIKEENKEKATRKERRYKERNIRKFGKELIRLLPLHYLTILYHLHCLSAVNYVLRLPWLNSLQWLL